MSTIIAISITLDNLCEKEKSCLIQGGRKTLMSVVHETCELPEHPHASGVVVRGALSLQFANGRCGGHFY